MYACVLCSFRTKAAFFRCSFAARSCHVPSQRTLLTRKNTTEEFFLFDSELLLDSVDVSHVLYYVPTVRIVSSFGHQEAEERAKLTEA
jgi:hypothetical protein